MNDTIMADTAKISRKILLIIPGNCADDLFGRNHQVQINALNILGNAPLAGELTDSTQLPGEFAATLHHLEQQGILPPRASSPPGFMSLVSVIGIEEVSSTQPNAGAEKLDLLPTKLPPVAPINPFLAAQFAWMLVPSGLPLTMPTVPQTGSTTPFPHL